MAGLGNYRIVVDFNGAIGQALLHSFVVTCAFTAIAVSLSWLLGCAAAILAQDAFRGRGLLRAIFLTPYALPAYTSVITWAFMFQYNNGLINYVLHNELGITSSPTFWLLGDNSFIALVTVSVWRNWPFAFLVVMAGLQSIPHELYEAAAIDGAGVRQQIRLITMPSLRPVNQVLVLVLFLWTFNDFTTPYCAVRQWRAAARRRHLDAYLQRVVPHLELRGRLSDVRAAAAVPAGGFRRLSAAHVEASRCIAPAGRQRQRRGERRWRRREVSSGPAGSCSPC